jgi:predicted histone-like DNA-binding protein
MAVKYNIVARKNPRDPEAPPKYYPVLNSTGRTNQRGLAIKGSQMSTLNSADLAASMEVLLTQIPAELAAGNIVDLGDFGTFRLTIKAKGAEKAEEVSAHNIERLSVIFTPGPEFKLALTRTKYEKLAS